jgi:F420-0:gamma-glutamyl ligase-like protein
MVESKSDEVVTENKFYNHNFEQLIVSAVGLILTIISILGIVSMISYSSAIGKLENNVDIHAELSASSLSFLSKYIAGLILGVILIIFSEIITNIRNKITK